MLLKANLPSIFIVNELHYRVAGFLLIFVAGGFLMVTGRAPLINLSCLD